MLVDQFEKIHSKKDQKLILISHQEKIIKMADRIMVIEDGRSEALAPKKKMVQSSLARVLIASAQAGSRNEDGERRRR